MKETSSPSYICIGGPHDREHLDSFDDPPQGYTAIRVVPHPGDSNQRSEIILLHHDSSALISDLSSKARWLTEARNARRKSVG